MEKKHSEWWFSKLCSPFVHIKIAGIYGSVHPNNIDNNRFWHTHTHPYMTWTYMNIWCDVSPKNFQTAVICLGSDVAEILALWPSNPALQRSKFVEKLPLLTFWIRGKTWAICPCVSDFQSENFGSKVPGVWSSFVILGRISSVPRSTTLW